MPIATVTLTGREEVADGTMAFYFSKPEGFVFEAGQFAELTLTNPPETDAEGNMRHFSIASAPYEKDLQIATRMRDTAFKRVLRGAAFGTRLQMDAPYGSFTLDKDPTIPAVFLTGGIGITPARSIVLQATRESSPRPILLFYSNRGPEEAAFLQALTLAATKNPRLTYVPTMTKMENSRTKWAGETGYITRAMLEKHIPDLTAPIYYISGPPAMITAMRKLLNEAGVTDGSIRTEEFTGY